MKKIRIVISYEWKERLLDLFKILVIVFAMWSIWLVSKYINSQFHMVVIIIFQGFIVFAVWVFGEYTRKRDDKVRELEDRLHELKQEV